MISAFNCNRRKSSQISVKFVSLLISVCKILFFSFNGQIVMNDYLLSQRTCVKHIHLFIVHPYNQIVQIPCLSIRKQTAFYYHTKANLFVAITYYFDYSCFVFDREKRGFTCVGICRSWFSLATGLISCSGRRSSLYSFNSYFLY